MPILQKSDFYKYVLGRLAAEGVPVASYRLKQLVENVLKQSPGWENYEISVGQFFNGIAELGAQGLVFSELREPATPQDHEELGGQKVSWISITDLGRRKRLELVDVTTKAPVRNVPVTAPKPARILTL
jgi:hypothetical protein